jgi:hypothetical protein
VGKIKGAGWVVVQPVYIYCEGYQGNACKRRGKPGPYIAREQGKEQWKEDVKLFFDCQRPGMQKGFKLGRSFEVTGLRPE